MPGCTSFRLRLLSPALYLALVAAGPLSGADAAGGTVRANGQPVPGAVVTAAQDTSKFTTITDENGHYQFDTLPAGTWQFSVEMFGFATATRQVAIGEATQPVEWGLELRPRPVQALRQRPPGQGQQRQGQSPAQAPAGFQNLTLLNQQTTDAGGIATPAPPAPSPDANANATEAFLVNGSLSQGLGQAQQQDDAFGRRPDGLNAPGDPSFGGGVPGLQGGRGGPGGGGPGGGGPPGAGGFGGGSFGGGGGGRGGFGGRGGGGGGGGFGQRADRRPGGGPPSFGNRARRGRQVIRGQAFFSLGNSALNARQYSLTGQTLAQPAYGNVRYGLNLGGPLNIPHLLHSDGTFFFLNYTGTRSRSPYDGTSTLPTALERAGDFSQSATTVPVSIYDPLTHTPFAGNRIPQSRLDPTALKLLAYIPLPNQPGTVQNYQFVTAFPQNNDSLQLRVNRSITRKDSVDVNLNLQNRSGNSVQLYGFTDETEGFGLNSAVGWNHTFSRTLLNSLRVSFSRNRSKTLPFFAYGSNVAAAIGINGTSTDPINFGPPNLSFTNYGGLSDGSPALTRNQTFSYLDTVSLIRGKHNFSLGGEVRRVQLNTLTDQNGRGTYSFSGLLTSAFDANGQPLKNTGYDLADFLLGLPQSSSVRFGSNSNYFRNTVLNAFVADDWRIRTNLTFNLGLRYEYFTPFSEKYGRMANLDIAPGFTTIAIVTGGQNGPYSGSLTPGLLKPDRNNFAPRLAIAWKPVPRKALLVRAGYSVFYNGSVYNQFPFRLASQPPFAKSATLTTSVLAPLTIENGFATQATSSITNTFAVDPFYRVGYAQTWNVSVQQTLPRQLVMELGYLGTKGTRLDIQTIPNQAPPGSPLNSEQRRQVSNTVGFTYDSSNGDSIYHAAQVRITRRFARGVSANVLYTLSKSIDNASSIGGGGVTVAQNARDLRAERGLSSFDQRHVLNFNYILTSPVADGGNYLLKDWTLSGGLTFASGTPFTARVLGNQTNIGGSGNIGSGRADSTGQPVTSGNGYFNPAAFTAPQPGTYGNAGRDTIPGIAQINVNLSFGRSFRVGDDRRRLEFRVESNNFVNHVNITSINTIVNASNYGLPLAAGQMRTISAVLRLRF